jgi:RHS repeat-associated protein
MSRPPHPMPTPDRPASSHCCRPVSVLADPSHPSHLDTTTWLHDAPTGLLANKLYADGKGAAYAYDSSGSLTNIAYSDATPDVAFQYDRLGRQVSAIVDGVSTNAYTYDPETLALSAETQNGMEIDRTTDALGRDTGFSLPGSPYAVQYAYDAYGRFHSVTSSITSITSTFTYSYLPNTELLSGMTASSGFLWTRAYESGRSLITAVENSFGETVISRYDYQNDALGRRVSRADSGLAFAIQPTYGDPATVEMPAYNAYAYNGRSEVTGAARRWGTDTGDTSDAVDGQQYAYAFDPIGNRITAAEGDTSRTAGYTANELNQYTQRTVPGVKELAGTALAEATVTVNDLPTDRFGPWWRHAFGVDNAASAAYSNAVVTAVYNPPGTNDPDVVSSSTGRVFVAETPEAFTYDDDGNLTRDGRFSYTWDGENHLISATTRDDLSADLPRVRVTHQYDHQSRRIATARETWSGSAWEPAGTNRYVYDGWNVVAETRSASPAHTNLYVWGLDLSGTLQGAGGIGGLLLVRKRLGDGLGTARNLDYLFDANGNVVQEIRRNGGSINAHYEYDPFGNTVVALRLDATDNPFRFSTKWFDNDTGLGYWGYRWYGPGMGRWLSRDPIGIRGGLNLYAFCRNRAIDRIDRVGLHSCAATKSETCFGFPITITKVSDTTTTIGTCLLCLKKKEHSCSWHGTITYGDLIDMGYTGSPGVDPDQIACDKWAWESHTYCSLF